MMGLRIYKAVRFVKYLNDHPPAYVKQMCRVELQPPLITTKSEANVTEGGQSTLCLFISELPPKAGAPV